jgi:cytochrome c oxidase cbb3-type subunit IV
MNTIRAAVTVTSFAVFIVICWWAWSARQKASFDAAAQLPLHDDDAQAAAGDTSAEQEVRR